ncbi:MAG: glutaredoxin 3 [bacterium]|nr:glutaredoxin 3 [bacterium]MCP5065258.1 glutaredoxin 3 [bacterium]
MIEIVMYTRSWCGYCHRAKLLLDGKSQAYIEHDIGLDPAKESEMHQRAQRTSVPQIFIGEVHVGGYDEIAKLERGGRLDNLLTEEGNEK